MVTGLVRLILIRCLFYLEPVASFVRLTVEDDRNSEVPALVQPDDALIDHRRPFHDHAIISSGANREMHTDRAGEHCDLEKQLNEVSERFERIGVAALVLPGQVADATEEVI
jgi:hypothetical protein